MDISRNSFHYRLYDKVFDRRPTSLCTYFWKVVFAAWLLFVLLPVVFCGLACSLFYVLIWFPLFSGAASLVEYCMVMGLTILLWSGVCYMVMGLARAIVKEEYPNSIWAKVLIKPMTDQERYDRAWKQKPSLLESYTRAKLDKVCPTIDLVD